MSDMSNLSTVKSCPCLFGAGPLCAACLGEIERIHSSPSTQEEIPCQTKTQ